MVVGDILFSYICLIMIQKVRCLRSRNSLKNADENISQNDLWQMQLMGKLRFGHPAMGIGIPERLL